MACTRSSCAALNEGRGVNPGDTALGLFEPGVNPGDTPSPARKMLLIGPLNEGRGVNPGDTPALELVSNRILRALNEGRGVNPGDTQRHDRHE